MRHQNLLVLFQVLLRYRSFFSTSKSVNPSECPKNGDFAPSEKYAAVPYGSPGWTDKEFYSHTIDPSAKLFAVSYEIMDCRASKVGMLLKCSANFTDGSEERRDAFGSVRAEYACCI